MIPLDRIKSMQPEQLVIYEAPAQPLKFYSGRVIAQPRGLT